MGECNVLQSWAVAMAAAVTATPADALTACSHPGYIAEMQRKSEGDGVEAAAARA